MRLFTQLLLAAIYSGLIIGVWEMSKYVYRRNHILGIVVFLGCLMFIVLLELY